MSNDDYSTVDELLKVIENKETDFVLVYKGKQGGTGIYHNGDVTSKLGMVIYLGKFFHKEMDESIKGQFESFKIKVDDD